MAYYTNIFSPETYEAFRRSDRTITGFRMRQHHGATRAKEGDKFACYLTKLSRWVGILDVLEGPFVERTPLFFPDADPFVVRFRVRPRIWLPVDKAVPIHESALWDTLSFTKDLLRSVPGWTGKLRTSLVSLSDNDGSTIEHLLASQVGGGQLYPLSRGESRKLSTRRARTVVDDVSVTTPLAKASTPQIDDAS